MPRSSARRDAVDTEAQSASQGSLLIVDGDASNRKSLRTLLLSVGYEVIAKSGFAEAAAAAAHTTPDLMIVNLDQGDAFPKQLPAELAELAYVACLSSESGAGVEAVDPRLAALAETRARAEGLDEDSVAKARSQFDQGHLAVAVIEVRSRGQKSLDIE